MGFGKADCVQPRPPGAGAGPRKQHEAQQQGQQPGHGALPPALLGKVPLRLAFPEVPTCWRGKDPIEVGTWRGAAAASRHNPAGQDACVHGRCRCRGEAGAAKVRKGLGLHGRVSRCMAGAAQR